MPEAAVKSNKEIRQTAKRAMTFTRGELLEISLVSIVTGGISLLVFFAVQIALMSVSRGLHTGRFGSDARIMKYVYVGLALYLGVSVIAGSFIELGLDRILLLKLKGDKASRYDLFHYRKIAFDAIFLRLFMSVRVMLWSVLFLIPGIIAVLNYSMAPFLLAQNPGIGVPNSIRVSKHLMKGYKWKLTKLILGYADEIIISVLLLGIPFIYVMPRLKFAVAAFYRERVRVHDEEVRTIERISEKKEAEM